MPGQGCCFNCYCMKVKLIRNPDYDVSPGRLIEKSENPTRNPNEAYLGAKYRHYFRPTTAPRAARHWGTFGTQGTFFQICFLENK